MEIREARPEDCAAIAALLRDAFPGGDEPALVSALRRRGEAALSLVACDPRQGSLLGHALFSAMASPPGALGLGPVATAAHARGRGVATALIRDGLARAREAGWSAVFVVGEPGFYGRFGFAGAAAGRWRSRYAGPHFMALELSPGALSAGGEAVYPPPFAEL